MAPRLNAKTAAARKRQAPKEAPDPVEESEGRPGSNIPDKTVLKFSQEALRLWQAAQKLKEQFDSANNTYRAKLKDAKAAGVETSAITRYIKDRDKDPADLDREAQEYYRVCRLMGLPVGTQLDIWGDGGSPARAVDETAISGRGHIAPSGKKSPAELKAHGKALAELEARKAEAAALGRKHGAAGKPMKSGYPGSSAEHLAYVYAYDEGQAKNLSTLGKGSDLKNARNEEEGGAGEGEETTH